MEDEDQAQWFERHLEDVMRLHVPGQLLLVSPDTAQTSGLVAGASPLSLDHSGFFYATLQKRP